MTHTAVVVGGSGALGSALVTALASAGWRAIVVDPVAPASAPTTVHVPVDLGQPLAARGASVLAGVRAALGTDGRASAVVNVAGGFGMASAGDFGGLLAQYDKMFGMSVETAFLAAALAGQVLSQDGTVVLTGATAAAGATPLFPAYGASKAAVQHLVLSLAAEGSGLPAGAHVFGIAPAMLDTPTNRAAMPSADRSSWTSLDALAARIVAWAGGVDRPAPGTIVPV